MNETLKAPKKAPRVAKSTLRAIFQNPILHVPFPPTHMGTYEQNIGMYILAPAVFPDKGFHLARQWQEPAFSQGPLQNGFANIYLNVINPASNRCLPTKPSKVPSRFFKDAPNTSQDAPRLSQDAPDDLPKRDGASQEQTLAG